MADLTSPSYIPGGPGYENWNYASQVDSMPSPFGQPGYGTPSSPAYQMAAPRDYMGRDEAYRGNEAFAPPGGINFGSPLANMIGSLAMQAFVGPNIRPFTKPDLPNLDFLHARERQTVSLQMANQIYGQSAPDLAKSIGEKAAGNPFVQMAWDALDPAGSQKGAFDMIYGRMGTSFGGDTRAQGQRAFDALSQMNAEFQENNQPGTWDFRKAHGLDRTEMVDAADAGARYGVGGMSHDKLTNARENGSIGTLMKDNSRVFAAAQEVFGKDKGMEELAQLMTRSIDGFQGLDSGKASDLLNKIQATSRAVNISTKAFAEYSSMFNDLAKSARMGGPTNTGQALEAAMSAKAATDLGRRTGDIGLSDSNKTMESAARNKIDTMASPTLRKAQALAARVANLTDSQAASIKVGNYGDLNSFFKSGAMQRLIDSGDTAGLEKFLNAANTQVQPNNFLKKGDVGLLSQNLSAQDALRAGTLIDFNSVGDFNANNMKRKISGTLEKDGRIDRDVLAKVGGAAGLQNFMGEFGSFAEVTDQKKIAEKLRSTAFGQSMSKEQQERFASQFSGQMTLLTNNENFLKGFGYASRDDANQGYSASSREGRAMIQRTAAVAKRSDDEQQFLSELAGGALRGGTFKETAGAIKETLKKAQEGTLVVDGKKVGVKDIQNEDGSVNWKKAMDVAMAGMKDAGKKILGVDEQELMLRGLHGDEKDQDNTLAEIAAGRRGGNRDLAAAMQETLAEGRNGKADIKGKDGQVDYDKVAALANQKLQKLGKAPAKAGEIEDIKTKLSEGGLDRIMPVAEATYQDVLQKTGSIPQAAAARKAKIRELGAQMAEDKQLALPADDDKDGPTPPPTDAQKVEGTTTAANDKESEKSQETREKQLTVLERIEKLISDFKTKDPMLAGSVLDNPSAAKKQSDLVRTRMAA